MKLHWKILIGLLIGLICGLVCNLLFKDSELLAWIATNIADSIGQVFLRLVFMVVVPLVFCALTLGVAGIGDVKALGRLGLYTLFMTLLFSSASVTIGLSIANLIRPGEVLSSRRERSFATNFPLKRTRRSIRQARLNL